MPSLFTFCPNSSILFCLLISSSLQLLFTCTFALPVRDEPFRNGFNLFERLSTSTKADSNKDKVKNIEKKPQSTSNDSSSNSENWTGILFGGRGVLKELFDTLSLRRAKLAGKRVQNEKTLSRLDFGRIFNELLENARRKRYDKSDPGLQLIPELPDFGICNRFSCRSIYRAIDQFRQSDIFANFQTALQLMQDPEGWNIIGEIISNPELLASLAGAGLPEKDLIPLKPIREEKSSINAGTDYYSQVEAIDSGNSPDYHYEDSFEDTETDQKADEVTIADTITDHDTDIIQLKDLSLGLHDGPVIALPSNEGTITVAKIEKTIPISSIINSGDSSGERSPKVLSTNIEDKNVTSLRYGLSRQLPTHLHQRKKSLQEKSRNETVKNAHANRTGIVKKYNYRPTTRMSFPLYPSYFSNNNRRINRMLAFERRRQRMSTDKMTTRRTTTKTSAVTTVTTTTTTTRNFRADSDYYAMYYDDQ